jgi:hypothetical protein
MYGAGGGWWWCEWGGLLSHFGLKGGENEGLFSEFRFSFPGLWALSERLPYK